MSVKRGQDALKNFLLYLLKKPTVFQTGERLCFITSLVIKLKSNAGQQAKNKLLGLN